MKTQSEKALSFAELHQRDHCFVAPNPWDAGSARLLEMMGFPALASTGAGLAFSLGLPDLKAPDEVMWAHLSQLCAATEVPLSADLEDCGGGTPEDVQGHLLRAVQTGIAGASIEDTTGLHDRPIRDMQEAADRVRAAVEAVRSLPHPFMLTARADNHFYGVQNLADTIARLQAYQEAGADVLFAPGLKTRDEVVAVMSSIDRPLNVLLGFADSTLTLDDMHELGVRRVSVGGSFARTAYSALIRAAQTIQTTGRFEHAKGAIPGPLLNRLFGDGLSLAERQTMLAQRYLNKGE